LRLFLDESIREKKNEANKICLFSHHSAIDLAMTDFPDSAGPYNHIIEAVGLSLPNVQPWIVSRAPIRVFGWHLETSESFPESWNALSATLVDNTSYPSIESQVNRPM